MTIIHFFDYSNVSFIRTLKPVRKKERAWFRKECVFKITKLLDAQQIFSS